MKKDKKVIITQSNYIPWRGYFDNLFASNEIVFLEDVQYTKRDWRNRNIIKTPQGPFWLSIPVKVKGKYEQKIQDVEIVDATWNQTHWKTLQANYSKLSGFAYWAPAIEELYRQAEFLYLSEINVHFIKGISRLLGRELNVHFSRDFQTPEDKSQRLLSICQALSATHYGSGPAAKDYLDVDLFKASGIEVEWFDYSSYPTYTQPHGEYLPGVSILDLMFSTGPEAAQYLKCTRTPSTSWNEATL